MVTFSVVAIIGIIGLVTGLGWAHFVRTNAQTAADAAATAGAEYVLNSAGQSNAIACGTGTVSRRPPTAPTRFPARPPTTCRPRASMPAPTAFTRPAPKP